MLKKRRGLMFYSPNFPLIKILFNHNDNSKILKKHDKKMNTPIDIENFNLLVNLSSNLPPRVKIPYFTGEEITF